MQHSWRCWPSEWLLQHPTLLWQLVASPSDVKRCYPFRILEVLGIRPSFMPPFFFLHQVRSSPPNDYAAPLTTVDTNTHNYSLQEPLHPEPHRGKKSEWKTIIARLFSHKYFFIRWLLLAFFSDLAKENVDWGRTEEGGVVEGRRRCAMAYGHLK